jgi:ABC-2 type transport system permease protein
MSLRRSWAIGRHEIRMLMDDPGTIVFLILMPMLMMAVMKPLFALSLQADGFAGASGAEQAVPGMAAMFASFSASFAGFGFFREHGWGTWDRLRASSATTPDIMIGKLGPVLGVSLFQLFSLFGLGVLLLGLTISGSLLALAMIIIAFSLAMLGFGMAITALSRTSLQLNTYANIGGIVFAAVGGALVPVTVLPQWVQSLAQATPTYWAMQGFLGTILQGEGIVDAIPGTLVLLAFAGVFASIAAVKFRFEETKVFYA